MKGARGLLISITGGKDLTLYEVDEAATRIREEVDQDANIIVGATFDESLDGIIRVSVVATGIEQASSRTWPRRPVHRAGRDLCLRRYPSRRPDRAAARRQPARRRSRGRRSGAPAAPSGGAGCAAAPRAPATTVERAALAAIAAAVGSEPMPQPASAQPAAYGDVTVRPIAQKPSLFADPEPAPQAVAEEPPPEAFIPPAAGPRRDRARRGCRSSTSCRCRRRTKSCAPSGETEAEHPQKRRMSLLQRLAAVGLGRRDEESEPPIAARAVRSGDAADAAAAASASRSAASPTRCAPAIRCRNMPAARLRRDSTRTAARRLWQLRPGRRSSGYPRLLAPPGQLIVCNTLRPDNGVPADSAGTSFFCVQRFKSFA